MDASRPGPVRARKLEQEAEVSRPSVFLSADDTNTEGLLVGQPDRPRAPADPPAVISQGQCILGAGFCRDRLQPALIRPAHDASRCSQIERVVWTTEVPPGRTAPVLARWRPRVHFCKHR